jgi:Di- and tricarboxylate transporters
MGMAIMGIFIGCIYAWCTSSMVWSSILGLSLLGLTGYCTVTDAFTKAISNSTVQLIFFMLVFASIASICGLTDVIADYIITRKIAKGRPWVLSFILIFACYVASALVDPIPAILICWGFLYTICKEVGYKPYEKWPELMVVGIVYGSIMGFTLFPFKVAVVANYGLLAAAMGVKTVDFSYLSFMVFAFIFGVACMVLYLLMCKYFLRVDVSKLTEVDLTQKERAKMDGYQKIGLWLLFGLIFGMLLENFLPAGSYIGTALKSFGTVGVVVFFIGIAVYIPYKGKPYMTFKKMADEGIAWNLVFMIAAAMTLSTALVADGAGFKAYLIKVITPLMGGTSSIVFISAFLIAALILTNFINNVAVSAIMIPVMYPFSQSLGFNPIAVTAVFIFMTDMAIMLPSASPSGAMIHGNREWITGVHAIKYAVETMILTAIAGVVIGIPLAMALF